MDRLTIDEAIEHCKEIARDNRAKADEEARAFAIYPFVNAEESATFVDRCDECAEEHEQLVRWLEELKEYQELEEQGLLLKLPCKIGDTVYDIDTIYECDNDYMDCIMEFPDVYQCERGFVCEYEHEKLVVRPKSFDFKMLDNFNKTVFLTKEEAEQALLKRLESAENEY